MLNYITHDQLKTEVRELRTEIISAAKELGGEIKSLYGDIESQRGTIIDLITILNRIEEKQRLLEKRFEDYIKTNV